MVDFLIILDLKTAYIHASNLFKIKHLSFLLKTNLDDITLTAIHIGISKSAVRWRFPENSVVVFVNAIATNSVIVIKDGIHC